MSCLARNRATAKRHRGSGALRGGVSATLLALVTSLLLGTVSAESPPVGPEFAADFMRDPKVLELGEQVWNKRCHLCHGKRARSGAAPRLAPERYEPAFVYDRVTNGFRGMPGWKHEFDQRERMAVTAYVLHGRFSP